MKLSIEFIQNDSSLALTVDGDLSKDKLNKVVGTACNELFRLVKLQKQTGARLFTLSQPVGIRVKAGKFSVDTLEASEALQSRLKLNSTAKSMKAFAGRVYFICDYLSTTTEVVTVEQAIQAAEIHGTAVKAAQASN